MNPIRVLLVDDDDTMRLVLRRHLNRAYGFGVLAIEEADSGERAIEILRDRSFDCIVSDYRMGPTTGIDVLAFAKSERPEAIRVLLTGFAAPALRKSAADRAEPHAFLEKPMTSAELESLVREEIVARFSPRSRATASGKSNNADQGRSVSGRAK